MVSPTSNWRTPSNSYTLVTLKFTDYKSLYFISGHITGKIQPKKKKERDRERKKRERESNKI